MTTTFNKIVFGGFAGIAGVCSGERRSRGSHHVGCAHFPAPGADFVGVRRAGEHGCTRDRERQQPHLSGRTEDRHRLQPLIAAVELDMMIVVPLSGDNDLIPAQHPRC